MRRLLLALAVLVGVAGLAAGAYTLRAWRALQAFGAEPARPAAACAAAAEAADATEEPGGGPAPEGTVLVPIPRGSSLPQVAQLLADAHVVSDARTFARWVKYVRRGEAAGIKAGEYTLHPCLTPADILARLLRGEIATVRVTIPEGWNLWEIAPALEEAGLTKQADFLAYARSPEAARAAGLPDEASSLEGYLFPDTYQLARNASLPDVVATMVRRYRAVFDADVRPRLAASGLGEHQVVTLASIVEKETGAPRERPHISAVFHNRMRQGMRLETDPTVIYSVLAAGLPWDGNLRASDLKRDAPYNTYKRAGLPPGPIASPGRAALLAAVAPDAGDDLFFVSHNDGTHEFCPTYDCHLRAVERWQKAYFRKPRGAANADRGSTGTGTGAAPPEALDGAQAKP